MFDSPLNRRTAFKLLGASVMAGLATPGRAASHASFDFDNPADNLRGFLKLTSSLADEPIVGWYSGMVFGNVPGEILRPLFRLEGFGVGQTTRQDNGTFQSSWKEVGYYKDVKTGQILEEWKNPYNDEVCEVMHIHNEAVNTVLSTRFPEVPPLSETVDFEMEFPNYSGSGSEFVLPWQVMDGHITLWNDFRGKIKNVLDPKVWKRESTGEYIRITELFQFVADYEQFMDPDLDQIDYTGAWNRLAPWLPWMLMGRHPGELFYRCTTVKAARFEDLPKDILAYTEKHYPDYLDYNTPWKMPNESSWEVYMKEREPVK